MQLNLLSPQHKGRKSIAVGRGGKRGKTSGHGGKGQTARAGHKMRPESRDAIKKFPKRRGYGKNRARTVRTNRIATSVVKSPPSMPRIRPARPSRPPRSWRRASSAA